MLHPAESADIKRTLEILSTTQIEPIGTVAVEVVPATKRTRTVKPQTVAELIDAECSKRKSGYCKAKGRKNPIAIVTYVPFKGAHKGQRREYAMMACGVYETGRCCMLKPFDDNGEIINKLLYRIREWKEEGFESLRLPE